MKIYLQWCTVCRSLLGLVSYEGLHQIVTLSKNRLTCCPNYFLNLFSSSSYFSKWFKQERLRYYHSGYDGLPHRRRPSNCLVARKLRKGIVTYRTEIAKTTVFLHTTYSKKHFGLHTLLSMSKRGIVGVSVRSKNS